MLRRAGVWTLPGDAGADADADGAAEDEGEGAEDRGALLGACDCPHADSASASTTPTAAAILTGTRGSRRECVWRPAIIDRPPFLIAFLGAGAHVRGHANPAGTGSHCWNGVFQGQSLGPAASSLGLPRNQTQQAGIILTDKRFCNMLTDSNLAGYTRENDAGRSS
jgi:hypothetical protein